MVTIAWSCAHDSEVRVPLSTILLLPCLRWPVCSAHLQSSATCMSWHHGNGMVALCFVLHLGVPGNEAPTSIGRCCCSFLTRAGGTLHQLSRWQDSAATRSWSLWTHWQVQYTDRRVTLHFAEVYGCSACWHHVKSCAPHLMVCSPRHVLMIFTGATRCAGGAQRLNDRVDGAGRRLLPREVVAKAAGPLAIDAASVRRGRAFLRGIGLVNHLAIVQARAQPA